MRRPAARWAPTGSGANRPELLDAEYAINEGGGTAIDVNGQTFYLCQTGEKGTARLRITASGPPGHASVPLDDTAMRRLGEALVRLTAWTSPTRLTEPVRQMLTTIAPTLDGDSGANIARLLDAGDGELSWDDIAALGLPFDPDMMDMLRATTRDTAVPTIVHGGHRINVIPSEVVLDVDGRILPGTDPAEWRDRVQQVVGDGVTVELLSEETGILADPGLAVLRRHRRDDRRDRPRRPRRAVPRLRRDGRPQHPRRQGLRLLPVPADGAQCRVRPAHARPRRAHPPR